MNEARTSQSAVVAMGATVIIWAYSWIVMKQVLQYAGPFEFAALRYALGTVVLFALLALLRRPLSPPPLLATAIVGVSQTAVFQGLGQLALTSGGAGHVALLAYAMPFWAVLLAWVILGEHPTRRQWLGLGLAVIGLTSVIAPWNGLGSVASTVYALLGGVFWALATVVSKRTFRRHDPDPLTFTAWQMGIGAAVLIVVAVVVPQRGIEWAPAFLGGLAFSVLMATCLAWTLWSIVVRRLPTAIASMSSLAVPVVSVFMAWGILHEKPTPNEWFGMAFIVAGLFAVSGIGGRPTREAD